MRPRDRTLLLGSLAAALLLPALTEAKEARPGGSAFLKSLVVPGWGQYSLGKRSAALTFFGSELALVGGMLAVNTYGRAARADYKALAAAYAGVVGDHDHDFYVDVGNWISVDAYNERRLRDRDFGALYTAPGDRWYWDSEEHRSEMERARVRSDRAFNSLFYFAGGLAINHIASAIHAGRLAVSQQRHASILSPRGWTMSVRPAIPDRGLCLSFTHSF